MRLYNEFRTEVSKIALGWQRTRFEARVRRVCAMIALSVVGARRD
jgi:hypothetical protein